MAKIENNGLVMTARGNFGKQFVYKKRGEELHIAKMPKSSKKRTLTEKQEQVRELFTEASLYAQSAIASPEKKQLYEKRATSRTTAYNIAFQDYLKGPVVKRIDTSEYNGTPGSTIVIVAMDNFRVVKVKVSIHSADGQLIEEGIANLNPENRLKWIYTATQANASLAGCKINVTALDFPGNKGTLEKTL